MEKEEIKSNARESVPEEDRINVILQKTLQWIKWIVIVFFTLSLMPVIVFRFVPPPVTPLMIKRAFERSAEGKKPLITKDWVRLKKISPHLIQAVVAAEDNRFLEHWGIDIQAIEKAVEHNKKYRRKRGASTITQQTAKNVFLWPARTYTRKAFELYFTTMIEITWSKKRIMEVYLNVIEMGDGIYGAEAAARKYFHKPAAKLTRGEAALIAAALPNPRKRNPAAPSAYMLRRQEKILDLMNKIPPIKLYPERDKPACR
ncbi:MAG: monofunctional biosynthetic peptidoglycan transglycosylase [Bacteroidales bacterium]|nr:monofunctional biosynthetic peptidoglycan transglycosylase [Bacteroidales bacterium]